MVRIMQSKGVIATNYPNPPCLPSSRTALRRASDKELDQSGGWRKL